MLCSTGYQKINKTMQELAIKQKEIIKHTIKHLHFELGHLYGSRSPISVTTPLHLQKSEPMPYHKAYNNRKPSDHYIQTNFKVPSFRWIFHFKFHVESGANGHRIGYTFQILLAGNNKSSMSSPVLQIICANLWEFWDRKQTLQQNVWNSYYFNNKKW